MELINAILDLLSNPEVIDLLTGIYSAFFTLGTILSPLFALLG